MMYKVVWGVSLSTVFLKEKYTSSVIIEKAFKKCISVCKCWCGFRVSERKMAPIIVVALMAHDTWILTSLCGIVYFLQTDTHYSGSSCIHWDETKLYCETEWMWSLFFQQAHHEGISSQDSVLVHDLCCRVCKPQFSYMDACAAVLLDFVPYCRNAQLPCKLGHCFSWRCLQSSTTFI